MARQLPDPRSQLDRNRRPPARIRKLVAGWRVVGREGGVPVGTQPFTAQSVDHNNGALVGEGSILERNADCQVADPVAVEITGSELKAHLIAVAGASVGPVLAPPVLVLDVKAG